MLQFLMSRLRPKTHDAFLAEVTTLGIRHSANVVPTIPGLSAIFTITYSLPSPRAESMFHFYMRCHI